MQIYLNLSQVKSLSSFFLNMSVAWFVAAFISSGGYFSLMKFLAYGLFSLYTALFLLKEVKND